MLKASLEMAFWRKITLFCLQACPVTYLMCVSSLTNSDQRKKLHTLRSLQMAGGMKNALSPLSVYSILFF